MRRAGFFAAAVITTALAGPALAAGTVKIGVLLPLTGNAAAAGQAAKAAIEVAAEIVNTAHPEMASLPLAPTAGLPTLGGTRLEPVFIDHQGDPLVGQSQVLQLITQEKVAALFGSYIADAILYLKAMHDLDFLPPMIIGDDSGFSDPFFLPAVANIAQGAMNRSAWDIGTPESATWTAWASVPLQRKDSLVRTERLSRDNPFDRFAIEPFGADRKAVGRVVRNRCRRRATNGYAVRADIICRRTYCRMPPWRKYSSSSSVSMRQSSGTVSILPEER